MPEELHSGSLRAFLHSDLTGGITRMIRKAVSLLIAAALIFCMSACSGTKEKEGNTPQPEKNGEVVILFTSDMHCGIDTGFRIDGLQQIRQSLEEQGYTTLLVDEGDAIQGETIGVLTQGQAVTEMMNAVHYDAAIPGNHEFDYGMDRFMELTEMAEFPYICCNLMKNGETVFPDHIVIEAAGMKIGFVGAVTPTTLYSSTPAYFQNENGEYIYSFLQGDDGTALYEAVQKAADAARKEGADYVYLLAHLGNVAAWSPWTYADVISNTRGIDAVLDGHSHDTDQIVMKNMDDEDVVRSACGTKLNCIGYSFISPDKGVGKTGIWSWPNQDPPAQVFGFENEITGKLDAVLSEFKETLERTVAVTPFELTINDPVEKDSSGNPVRMVRRAETNLADLVTDAIREATGAQIAILNGGSLRMSIPSGEIAYKDIINVLPFCNSLCSVELTGQQILDALEWGCRSLPDQAGGFLQVSGLSYEIDISVTCSFITDENGMFAGVSGERRVRNVTVAGEEIDPEKTYSVGSVDYILLNCGDGYTMFKGAPVIFENGKLDSQSFIDYLTVTLEGTVPDRYADPYGSGRIKIIGQ